MEANVRVSVPMRMFVSQFAGLRSRTKSCGPDEKIPRNPVRSAARPEAPLQSLNRESGEPAI